MFKKGNIPWNEGRVKQVHCSYCGKSKIISLYKYNQYKRFYCNIKCRTKDWIGKNNPMFGKKQSEKCKRIVGQMSKKFTGKNNPMFGKKIDLSGKNCFYDDLGHRCRSSWEVNYARILKHLKIKYEYEPTSFELNEGDSYTPDFYLINNEEYIEIKGYARDLFKEKINRFKEQYPEIKLKIIYGQEYNNLLKNYKDKIVFECGGKVKQTYKFKECQINEIKKSFYSPKKIYNLEVESDNTFIVNGIVVHNSPPHKVDPEDLKKWCRDKWGDEDGAFALAKHIKKHGTKPHPFIRPILHQEFPKIIMRRKMQYGIV